MKKSNVSKNKVSMSQKQDMKHGLKKEKKKALKVPEGVKKEMSLVPQATPESFPTVPVEKVYDQDPYFGVDSTAIEEITILYKEEERKDPEFAEVNEWLEKIGEGKGGDEDEE